MRLTGEDVLIVNGVAVDTGAPVDPGILTFSSPTISHDALKGSEAVTENRKVWVSADSSHDLTAAKAHGEIVTVVPGKVNVFASDALRNTVEAMLKDSGPEDFCLLAGNMLVSALVYNCLMELHGKVNILIYSFRQEIYEIRTIREAPLPDEEVR